MPLSAQDFGGQHFHSSSMGQACQERITLFDRKRYPLQSPALQELTSLLKLLFLLIQAPVSRGRRGSRAVLLQSSTWSNQPHWKPLRVSLWPCVVPSKQTHTAHLQRQFSSSARMSRHRLSHQADFSWMAMHQLWSVAMEVVGLQLKKQSWPLAGASPTVKKQSYLWQLKTLSFILEM